MSEHTRRHGKRQVQTERASLGEYWVRYRAWVHGMSRGEKIRYRALQNQDLDKALLLGVDQAARHVGPARPDHRRTDSGRHL